jgi:hypothetical protein
MSWPNSSSDAELGAPFGADHYYGVQPYRFLESPYWWACINGASFVTIGFFVWYLEPRLKGWGRALFLVLPPIGMMIAYFSIGWIHIMALNSTLPTAMKWTATTIMMAGHIPYIRGIAHFVAVLKEEVVHVRLPAARAAAHVGLRRGASRHGKTCAAEGSASFGSGTHLALRPAS